MFLALSFLTTLTLFGQDLGTQAWQLKQRGEPNAARELLETAVKNSANSIAAWWQNHCRCAKDPESLNAGQ